MTKAFNTWVNFAFQQMTESVLVSRCLMMLQHNQVSAALATWIEKSSEMKRQKDLVRKAVMRTLHNMVSAAYQQWKSFAKQMRAEMRLVRKAASHLIHQKVVHVLLAERAVRFWLVRERNYLRLNPERNDACL